MNVQYRNGFPQKKYIERMLELCGVDPIQVTFNADYSEKRGGILWKAHSLDEKLREFVTFAESYDVKVKYTSFEGRIHSIWFQKTECDE